MEHAFIENIFKEGNRYFIKIPFNVWKECETKGLIPVKVSIENTVFECKLIPKGEGVYYIPVKKEMMNQINDTEKHSISFKIINGLTRINHDSPYSTNNPVRKIDTIKSVNYPKKGYCGQICLAMLTGKSVEEIINITKAKAWQYSFSKIIETLDYFGISHDTKIIYTKGNPFVYPKCCIVNRRCNNIYHFSLYYKGKYYDTDPVDTDMIVGYLKINIE